jgi:hypothetical protein
LLKALNGAQDLECLPLLLLSKRLGQAGGQSEAFDMHRVFSNAHTFSGALVASSVASVGMIARKRYAEEDAGGGMRKNEPES